MFASACDFTAPAVNQLQGQNSTMGRQTRRGVFHGIFQVIVSSRVHFQSASCHRAVSRHRSSNSRQNKTCRLYTKMDVSSFDFWWQYITPCRQCSQRTMNPVLFGALQLTQTLQKPHPNYKQVTESCWFEIFYGFYSNKTLGNTNLFHAGLKPEWMVRVVTEKVFDLKHFW